MDFSVLFLFFLTDGLSRQIHSCWFHFYDFMNSKLQNPINFAVDRSIQYSFLHTHHGLQTKKGLMRVLFGRTCNCISCWENNYFLFFLGYIFCRLIIVFLNLLSWLSTEFTFWFANFQDFFHCKFRTKLVYLIFRP